jgi:hypothetical protein
MRKMLSVFLITAIIATLWAGAARSAEDQIPPEGYEASEYGFNITAGDLLDPATASTRLDYYLSWLEWKGFKKEARVICQVSWGQWIVEPYWLPVFAARGWKVLCIVGDDIRYDNNYMAWLPWVQHVIDTWGPNGANILLGIEPANEPWNVAKWKPTEYGEWHRAVAQITRQAGLPVLAGYFSGHKKLTKKIWKFYWKAGINWDTDVDVITLNVTEVSVKKTKKSLRYLNKKITNFYDREWWFTEGNFKHLRLLPDKIFIYTCNGENTGKEHLNRCPEAN